MFIVNLPIYKCANYGILLINCCGIYLTILWQNKCAVRCMADIHKYIL